jgi:hypothetical protein
VELGSAAPERQWRYEVSVSSESRITTQLQQILPYFTVACCINVVVMRLIAINLGDIHRYLVNSRGTRRRALRREAAVVAGKNLLLEPLLHCYMLFEAM